VEWAQAGRKKIRVTDDGAGIAPEQVALALERHATSKITDLEDLEKIRTFGFRGEALPSIAAVSRFKLVSRTAEAAEGRSIECDGGKIVREGPCGAPAGTTVTVEDLFFCTPAREKFLKSDTTERGLLLRTLEDVALAARDVAFDVITDGKELLSLRPAGPGADPAAALLERIKACWGADRFTALKPVHEVGRFMSVFGWISDVHAHQSTGRHQRFYVNNRPVLSRRLTHVLYEAYRGGLMVGRHPAAVIFLSVDPTLVDVNVHPSKREVRLSHEEEAYGFLYHSLKKALSTSAEMPSALAPAGRPAAPAAEKQTAPPHPPRHPESFKEKNLSLAESQAALFIQSPLKHTPPEAAPPSVDNTLPETPSEDAAAPRPEDFRKTTPTPLMQMDGTYILARLGNDLYIFDQHAAAERVLYEKFSENAKDQTPHRQVLLLPWLWEVSLETAAIVTDCLKDFERLGYRLEPFGPQVFRVTAVPSVLGDSPKVRTLLEGLAEDLMSEAIPRRWDDILIRAACRGAVKAHDPLQPSEMEKILKDLQLCRLPWSCPHGRPTFLRLSPDELAKKFRRI